MIIGEIINVRINGKWYEAEILDITSNGAYVYVYDLGRKVNVTNANMR